MAGRVGKKGAAKSAVKPAGEGSTQAQLEKSKNDYADLYDFAPVGYFTFNGQASTISVNLTGAALLGVERPKLLKRKFRPFVAPADAGRWDSHFVSVLRQENKAVSCCSNARTALMFNARLNSISGNGRRNLRGPHCRKRYHGREAG